MSYSYMKYRWEKDFELKTDPAKAKTTKNAFIGTTAPNKAVLNGAWRIYLDGMSGADVVWVKDASSNEIHGGNGSDTVYLLGNAKYNYVDGGNGNDHIVIQAPDGRSNRNMILGGGNKDTFILQATDIANIPTTFMGFSGRNGTHMPVSEKEPPDETTIGDYQYADDTIQLKTVTSDRSYAIDLSNRDAVNDAFDTDGRLTVSLGFYNNNNGSYGTRTATVLLRNSSLGPSCYKAVIQQVAADNKDFTSDRSQTSYVWWAKETSSKLDAYLDDKPHIMIGSNNGDVADTIIGGKQSDTIYAGSNDIVNGGAGNDSIDLMGATSAYVRLSSGNDNVKGFLGGFSDDSDVVLLADSTLPADFKAAPSGSDFKISKKSSSLLLQDIANADLGGNGNMKGFLLQLSGKEPMKYAGVDKESTGTMLDDEIADYYQGNNSSLDASALTDDIIMDLGNTGKYANDTDSIYKDITYKGIIAVKGSDHGDNKLIGAADTKNTLMGGTGSGIQNSLYGGGASNDLLVGGDGAEDFFFYYESDGKDTIQGYNADQDVIVTGTAAPEKGTRDADGTVKITWSEYNVLTLLDMGTDPNATIYYSTDKGVSTTGLRVGLKDEQNTFTYAEDVSAYYGGTKGDTLTLSGTEDAKVWLDGSHSVRYDGITALDASGASGNLELAGSAAEDTIIGGSGNNSLWGGAGDANDVLTGGSGYNEFFFNKGEGHDIITASNNGDKVMLYDTKAEDLDLSATGVQSSGDLVIHFLDGSRLTLKGYASQGAETFQFKDAAYHYDHSSGTWA